MPQKHRRTSSATSRERPNKRRKPQKPLVALVTDDLHDGDIFGDPPSPLSPLPPTPQSPTEEDMVAAEPDIVDTAELEVPWRRVAKNNWRLPNEQEEQLRGCEWPGRAVSHLTSLRLISCAVAEPPPVYQLLPEPVKKAIDRVNDDILLRWYKKCPKKVLPLYFVSGSGFYDNVFKEPLRAVLAAERNSKSPTLRGIEQLVAMLDVSTVNIREESTVADFIGR